MKRAVLLLMSLFVMALLAGGCGSSSSDGGSPQPAATPSTAASTPTPALSKSAYIRKADRVCREMRRIRRRLDGVYGNAMRSGQPGAAADALDRYAPIYGAWLQQLQALPVPKRGAGRVTLMLEILANQAATATPQSVAVRTNQTLAINQIRAAHAQAVKNVAALGRSYGLKVCARAA
jgi:hypothetical protein